MHLRLQDPACPGSELELLKMSRQKCPKPEFTHNLYQSTSREGPPGQFPGKDWPPLLAGRTHDLLWPLPNPELKLSIIGRAV